MTKNYYSPKRLPIQIPRKRGLHHDYIEWWVEFQVSRSTYVFKNIDATQVSRSLFWPKIITRPKEPQIKFREKDIFNMMSLNGELSFKWLGQRIGSNKWLPSKSDKKLLLAQKTSNSNSEKKRSLMKILHIGYCSLVHQVSYKYKLKMYTSDTNNVKSSTHSMNRHKWPCSMVKSKFAANQMISRRH